MTGIPCKGENSSCFSASETPSSLWNCPILPERSCARTSTSLLWLPTSGTSSSLIHSLFRGRRGPSLPRWPLNHYLGLSAPHQLPHQPTVRQWEHWAPQAWPSPEPKAAAAEVEVWICERRHRGGSQGSGCGKRRLLLALQVLGSAAEQVAPQGLSSEPWLCLPPGGRRHPFPSFPGGGNRELRRDTNSSQTSFMPIMPPQESGVPGFRSTWS